MHGHHTDAKCTMFQGLSYQHKLYTQVLIGFEGGQSALTRRMPKFGFRKNRFNRLKEPEQLNLGKLAYHIEKGDLDPTQPITMRNLYESGAVSKIMYGVKLLGKGTEKF